MTRPPDDLLSLSGDAESSAPVSPPSRWRSRVLLPSVVLAAVAAIVIASSWNALLPRVRVRVVPCVVKSVEASSSTVNLQASGWIEPDPYPVLVSALTDGIVEEVLALEGESVAAGQVVARLVRDDARLALEAADAELELRRAEIESYEARREASKEILDTLVDRRETAGASRARVREHTSGLEGARAAAEAAVASLRALEEELRRKSGLVDSGAVSELELSVLTKRVEAARATSLSSKALVDAARGKLDEVRVRETAAATHMKLLIEERRALRVAKAELAAATARERLARARRDEAALRFDRTEVRSPASGVVLERLVDPGTSLAFNGPHAPHVLHLYDPKKLQVRTDIPIADAALVGQGQRAEIVVEALPDEVFRGRVTRFVHEADIQKNTVEVKVAIDDPRPELKPEMIARVRLLASGDDGATVRERVFAPQALLEADASGRAKAMAVIDRRGARGRVELRTVSLGSRRISGWVEVLEGLSPGDVLVAEPRDAVGDGTLVEIVGESAEFKGDER